MRKLGLLLSFFLMAASMVYGAAAHFPTNEDLRHFRAMNAPRLSPDGRRVLIEVQDSTADGGRWHIWLFELNDNSFRQLTFSPPGKKNDKDKGETSGEWMANGDILFLAHRGEHSQLFRLPMQGGEAVAFDLKIVPPVDMSKEPDAVPPPGADKQKSEASKGAEPVAIDVSGFEVAPDGKTIAIWAKDPQTPGEKKQQDEKADAVWVNHDPHLSRLYLMDPATSKLTPTAAPGDVERAAWSGQSDQLIAEVEAPNGASDLGPARSLWLVKSGDPQHPSKLQAVPPTARAVVWDNNSQGIFFLAQARQDAPPGYEDLYQFQFGGNGARDLSDGLQGSIGYETPIVGADGAVLLSVEDHEQATVGRFVAGKPAELLHFNLPQVRSLNTNLRHSGWVYLASSSTQPDTLYYTSELGAPGRALSTPSMTPPDTRAVATRLVHWSSDGRTIDGLVSLPPEATGQRVPLVVDVHGGPLGAWLDGYNQFTNFLVGQGWAVLRVNPRGSSGRGAAFAAANKNDLGGGDYRDIMSGVDAVVKQFSVDPQRLALIGYSYGGEMAGFVEGKTDRFKAIVSGAPVIDQFSEYGTESDSWYDRWYFGKPWEHMADSWRQSPLAGAAHAHTPFLLLQGEADTTDPLGQSQEMYRALRQMGVPVEMVQYPRDNHGPLAIGLLGRPSMEPWHGFDARQRMVQFLSKALGQVKAGTP
ncbi:MAG TPA: prolyl oligopeptidase family serine peptidase [Terriglobales bacterium]|nr:prolyl oligopeptidase family serine peptidase [Terriglobales bacterium]